MSESRLCPHGIAITSRRADATRSGRCWACIQNRPKTKDVPLKEQIQDLKKIVREFVREIRDKKVDSLHGLYLKYQKYE